MKPDPETSRVESMAVEIKNKVGQEIHTATAVA